MVRQLVLFTHAFPYGTGEEFLEDELAELAVFFDRIRIVSRTGDRSSCREVPANAAPESACPEHPQPLARKLRQTATALCRRPVWHELLTRAPLSRPAALRRLLYYHTKARDIAAWILANRPGFEAADTLFYTYWLGYETLAFRLVRQQGLPVAGVTRVHGQDLYPERHVPPYLPFHKPSLEASDGVFPISEHGQRYLANRYGSDCVDTVHRLGVPDHGSGPAGEDPNTLVIVSCSYVVPVKRIRLLVEGIQAFADRRAHLKIHWHHIGGGPLLEAVVAYAARRLPENVTPVWHGSIAHRRVFAFYRETPVDVFMNVSRSEGIPVSMMEAASFGIPLIATAVGGVPEIVTSDNGILLEADPQAAGIAEALDAFHRLPRTEKLRLRQNSRTVWKNRYDARKNYRAFGRNLLSILDERKCPSPNS